MNRRVGPSTLGGGSQATWPASSASSHADPKLILSSLPVSPLVVGIVVRAGSIATFSPWYTTAHPQPGAATEVETFHCSFVFGENRT